MSNKATEIFNDSDVRILAISVDGIIEFRLEANVENNWQFQATAYHLKSALLLAEKLIDFMQAR